MATPKKHAKPRPVASKKPKSVRIRVELDEAPSYYVNHVEVGYSANEFALNAARAPTLLVGRARATAEAAGELVINAELQLLFPARIAKAMAKVLGSQIAAYEAQFGPIKEGD